MRRDDKTRERLFANRNLSALARSAGMTHSTIYNRRANPGKITLDELVGLTKDWDDLEAIGRLIADRR